MRLFIYTSILFLALSFSVNAKMKQMSNLELDAVSAGNVLYAFKVSNSSLSISADNISFTDSGLINILEFQGITIDNGSGEGFCYDTPVGAVELYFMTDGVSPGFRYLVYEIPDMSSNLNLPHINAANISFCGTDLGSLAVENIAMAGSRERLDLQPKVGGLNHDLNIAMSIGEIRYTYDSAGGALSLGNIHLSESAAGVPENPALWNFSGPFRVGNIDNLTPAAFGANYDIPVPAAQFDLPMSGCIRIENVSMGANNFGPAAIDGIKMHSFYVRIPGTL